MKTVWWTKYIYKKKLIRYGISVIPRWLLQPYSLTDVCVLFRPPHFSLQWEGMCCPIPSDKKGDSRVGLRRSSSPSSVQVHEHHSASRLPELKVPPGYRNPGIIIDHFIPASIIQREGTSFFIAISTALRDRNGKCLRRSTYKFHIDTLVSEKCSYGYPRFSERGTSGP